MIEVERIQKLKELEIGDYFFNSKDKSKKVFLVRGKCVFNPHHGSSTRMCQVQDTGEEVSKSCRLNVIKTRESKFKEQLKLKPL